MPQSRTAKLSAATRTASPSPIPVHIRLPPITPDNRRETEEILNSILPPREWEEEGQLWRQQVHTYICQITFHHLGLKRVKHTPNELMQINSVSIFTFPLWCETHSQ